MKLLSHRADPCAALIAKNLYQIADYEIPENSRISPYEQVKDSPREPFPYTELDIHNQVGRETDNHVYQGLLKREADYVIPANTVTEPLNEAGCCEVKTPSGYTELDLTKLAQECDASYQQLITE